MSWTKENVEASLIKTNSLDTFIKNGGILKLCICEAHLLFFAKNDNTVSAYYEYLPTNIEEVTPCVNEFCSYAIPYLKKCLVERSDKSLLASCCINPIRID